MRKRGMLLLVLLTSLTQSWAGPLGPDGSVTFIHFNDLHAHLTPHQDLVPHATPGQTATEVQTVERGGLARTATLIEQIRAAAPQSILMNIGDTFHGGVEALFTRGNAIVDPVNALGIDVGVPGNWDYAYSPSVTRARFDDRNSLADIQKPNYPNLAANVTYTRTGPRSNNTFLPPTLLLTKGDIVVGLIGLSSDIVPQMHQGLAVGFDFLQGETAYVDLINQYATDLRRQGAHIIVVMSELGIQKDYRLANIINHNAVDVFFSAHTHEATFTPLQSASGAVVVEAGNDGYLGRMDVTVNNGRVSTRDWSLLEVTPDIPEDPQIAALVAAARAPFLDANVNMTLSTPAGDQQLSQPIDAIVGYTEVPLDRRQVLESRFNNFFTDALRLDTGTQLAMTPGFRYDSVVTSPVKSGQPPIFEDNQPVTGAVTLEDVYRFFPVVYTLSTAQITGANLRAILEEALTTVFSADAFKQEGGWVAGFSGFTAELDLSHPDGQRVLSMNYKDSGQPIGDGDVLSISGCTRPMDDADVLCSYHGFTDVTAYDNPQTQNPYTVVDWLVKTFNSGVLPITTRQDLQDASGTAMWPESPFVQPLEGVGF